MIFFFTFDDGIVNSETRLALLHSTHRNCQGGLPTEARRLLYSTSPASRNTAKAYGTFAESIAADLY